MRLHVAGRVDNDQQRCVVCRDILFDVGQDKVDPGTRIAESMHGDDSSERALESLTPEESLPLGLYACKPPS
jgi:hypothetical protein